MDDEKYRVMIVEDIDDIRHGLRISIDWLGHGCIVIGDADCGSAALELYAKLNPDIILTDIRMPDFSGLELIERIQVLDKHSSFIIISAYDEFSYAQKALELGAICYLLKPIDPKELYAALDKAKRAVDRNRRNNSIDTMYENSKQYEQIIDMLDTINSYARQEKYLKQAIEIIAIHYNENITVDYVSSLMHISSSYLIKLFKNQTDYSFIDVVTVYRLKNAIKLMKETDLKVYEISEKVGYKDPRYFSDVFKKYFGISPSHHSNEKI